MKAFVCERYGPPETLRMAEVEKPAPDADEVLVKVLAVSVNPADWHSMRAKPAFSRATLGLLRPKHTVLGVDIAGKVEAVGRGVTRFEPGDEVYANLLDHGYGGFAEYVSVPVDVMSLKPANLSFEEAAAVPMAAVTALQGLRHHGEIQPARKVLINGASGGVGTFAVQIAKSHGAEVTGVTSTRNIDLVRSLGADHVVDYTTTDFVRNGRRYDLILDTVGNRSVSALRRALGRGGKAAVVGFTDMAKLMGVSLRGGKDIATVSAHVATKELELLSEWIEAGKVRPEIDRCYPFAEIPAAIAYLEQGHARGKVVAGVAEGLRSPNMRGRELDVKTDRTQQWIALGQAATDEVIGPPEDSTEDSWSLLRACCVAPVVQLIRASRPRLFAISGPAGAGKSTVANAVSRSLANVGMRAVALSMDDFYLSRRVRERRGIAWRAAPGSHDIDLMVQTLAAIHDGSRPLVLPRFDKSRDDRSTDECLEDAPDVVLFDGWIIGYEGQGYGRILPYLDWHLHLDIPTDVARHRRFDRETKLREETGGAFAPEEMEQFWDEVLGPGMDTWVRDSAEHADIVVRCTATGRSCLADPRLDEFLPGRPG